MAKKVNIGAVVSLDGEKEYRNAISNINSDMKVLNSEMKLSKAEFSGQSNSVEALTQKDKVLSDTIDKQKQKVEMLKQALANAQEQYGENDSKTKNWKTSLNNAEAQLYKMDDELKTNKKYMAEAESNTDGCATSIDKFGKEVKETSTETTMFGSVLKANLTSTAIVEGVKALGNSIKEIGTQALNSVKDTAGYADTILTLSNNTGIATDTLQELKYMEEMTDVSLETVTSTMARSIRSMNSAAEGTSSYANAYKKLGIVVTDSNGKLRSNEEVYWEVIDALGKMTNETERDAISMKIFGKSAQELNSIVKIGSNGVKQFANEAREVGAVLDDNTLSALGETDDSFQRLTQTVEIVKRKFGTELAPSFEKGANKISKALNEMDDSVYEVTGDVVEGFADALSWSIENLDIVVGVIESVTAAIVAQKVVNTVTKMWDAYTTSQQAAATATGILNAVQAASPIGAIALGVGGIVAAFTILPGIIGEADSEASKLADDVRELNESSKETAASWKSVSKEIDDSLATAGAEAGKYQVMSDKLYNLASKEKLSNAEKAQMKKLVDELNVVFPQMGLELDSITGKLNKEQSAVNSTIDSYKKKLLVQAAEEDLSKIASEQYDAQMKLAEATETQAKAHESLSTFIAENKELYDEYNNAVNNYSGNGISQSSILASEFAGELNSLKVVVAESDESVKSFNETIDEQNKKFEEVMNVASGYSDEMKNTTSTTIEFKNKTVKATKEAAEAWSEVAAQYDTAYSAAYESITGQMSLFDEFNDKSDISKDQILTNLQSQINGMENWSENLQALAKKGIDEGLLKELADMGPQSAGYLNELTKMSNEEIQKLNNLWKNKYNAASSMASATAELKTKASEQFNSIVSSSQMTIDKIKNGWNNAKPFVEIGKNIINGLFKGMNDESNASSASNVKKITSATVSLFKNMLGIHSPSKVFAEIGKFSAQGIGVGFEDEMGTVNKKMAGAINTSYSFTTASNSGASQSYNLANALASAFASLNLKINVDGQDFGNIVSDAVVREVMA